MVPDTVQTGVSAWLLDLCAAWCQSSRGSIAERRYSTSGLTASLGAVDRTTGTSQE
jgi:hypothetical protein